MPETKDEWTDPRFHLERVLLSNMKREQARLAELLESINGAKQGGSEYENAVYRFYHGSFKVYEICQSWTESIVKLLSEIAPEGRSFCDFFQAIVAAGTGRSFTLEDNELWVERTGPIVEAFFHARFFLEIAVKYAGVLDEPPQMLPTGWAALLCLYGIR